LEYCGLATHLYKRAKTALHGGMREHEYYQEGTCSIR